MAGRDKPGPNHKPSLIVLSSAGDDAIVNLWANPTTHRLLVDASVSSLTITDIQDGAGDSIMDATNNAIQVSIVNDSVGIGGGVQYAVDAALGSTPTGNLVVAIRDDALSALTPVEGDAIGLRVDGVGALWVNGSAFTQPVSGTFWQATQPVSIAATVAVTQSGAWDEVGINDSGNVITTDGSGVAGTPAGGVLTIQGVTSMTPVQIGDNSASLTVDAPVGTPVFVRLSDGASAITTLPVSLASVPSHAVTNAGTFVTQENGAALTSLQLIDDVIIADDAAFTPATTKVAMAGFTFDDVSPDTVNEGDGGAARMSANRNIYVNIRDNAGNERGLNVDSSGNITVAAIGTSVTPGTAAANLGKAEDAAHSSGDTGVMALAVANVAQSTFGADGDYTPQAVDTKGNLMAGGNIAHDGVDAGNPLKVGFKAVASPKGVTLVSASDRSDAIGDVDGIPITKLDTANDDVISERISNTDGSSTAFSNFGAVASTHNCVRSIVCWNSSATNGYVDFRDGTAGSILWTMPLPATGGSILPPCSPFHFRTSQNTALAYDVSAALTTVYISISGYQSKS